MYWHYYYPRSLCEDCTAAEWQEDQEEEDHSKEEHTESLFQWELQLWRALRADPGEASSQKRLRWGCPLEGHFWSLGCGVTSHPWALHQLRGVQIVYRQLSPATDVIFRSSLWLHVCCTMRKSHQLCLEDIFKNHFGQQSHNEEIA